ncbi:dTDP-4-dehydrorhamnose 3,5-epimerase [Asticcacaulis biprosthecium C19]|uniref:dTDP-4-dehydrorhamnose 3,5-epimerase n=1 Tax=Asticcacaulis biprosthecium C19 TaxID=715226 RepID=F4QM24_9CAUL|nr:dTDP-4-dehydrorhamnose 3,5-epimerase [Asticcacaulis biprosthecium]EGF93596.1 dTDP-4-dehydrorhamnose 3,5-epimerase [Asticcacaulis biprosthecium C19]
MQFERFDIEGPALIRPKMIGDERGFFMEAFKDAWFRENVEDVSFVQDNQSLSRQVGTIRGLHYQTAPFGQGKLVRCLKGSIFDVAVDIRRGSATFGKWVGATLTAEKGEQLWVPDGFAHAFCTLEPDTEVFYKVTNPYSKPNDAGLAFDDPDIGIIWPIDIAMAVLSDKDRLQPPLSSLIS